MSQRGEDRTAFRRGAVAHVLLGLGVLAVCSALVFSYLQRNVFDSAQFADHAQAALKTQAVRDYASRELTDQLIAEVAPDAVAVGPLIETISGAVIQSDAFGRAFRSSVLQLHHAVVTGDTSGAVLTVANVGVLVSGALERVSPGLARQIPEGFDAALVALANVRAVDGIVRSAKAAKWGWRISAVAALALLMAAFVLSPRRRRMLRSFGFALIAGGAALMLLWLLARAVVVRSVIDGSVAQHDAARELWDAFMYGLFIEAVVLAAVGAVIAAAADGLLTGVDLERRLQRLVVRAAQPPERPAVRVLWALALLVLGVLVAFNPATFARAIIVLLGVLIGARGFQSLVVLMAPPEREAPAPTVTELARTRRRRRLAAAAAVALLLVVVVVVDARYGRGLETLGIVTSTTQCNGSDSLCAKRLNQVALATTHNSMAERTAPGFLFPAQESSIGTQLSDGIRGLQLDVYYGFPGTRVYTDADRSSPEARAVMEREFGHEFVAAADRVRRSLSRPQGVAPRLYLCHGFCEIGATALDVALAQIRAFMRENPREVVAIVFEDHVPWESLAGALEETGLSRYGYRGPWQGELPEIGKMIGDGKRLLLLTENAKPSVPWMHNAYEFFQETPFRFRSISALAAKDSCREQRGAPQNPMFLINHWVDTPPNPRPSIARRVNAFDFLWKRVEQCRAERGLFPNMIAVDFYRQGDLFRVVDKLNGVR